MACIQLFPNSDVILASGGHTTPHTSSCPFPPFPLFLCDRYYFSILNICAANSLWCPCTNIVTSSQSRPSRTQVRPPEGAFPASDRIENAPERIESSVNPRRMWQRLPTHVISWLISHLLRGNAVRISTGCVNSVRCQVFACNDSVSRTPHLTAAAMSSHLIRRKHPDDALSQRVLRRRRGWTVIVGPEVR